MLPVKDVSGLTKQSVKHIVMLVDRKNYSEAKRLAYEQMNVSTILRVEVFRGEAAFSSTAISMTNIVIHCDESRFISQWIILVAIFY